VHCRYSDPAVGQARWMEWNAAIPATSTAATTTAQITQYMM
jgi:hypothetical protein